MSNLSFTAAAVFSRNLLRRKFFSKFIPNINQKLGEVYPHLDERRIQGVSALICEKVNTELKRGGMNKVTWVGETLAFRDFIVEKTLSTTMEENESVDIGVFNKKLWRVIWEVTHGVFEEIEEEASTDKMKNMLAAGCREMRERARFLGGENRKYLCMKWARQEMEKSNFEECLRRAQSMDDEEEEEEEDEELGLGSGSGSGVGGETCKWPEEPNPLATSGNHVDSLLGLKVNQNPIPLLRRWEKVVQPRRVDWEALVAHIKEHKHNDVYTKIVESALSMESFRATIGDYVGLIFAVGDQLKGDKEQLILKLAEDGKINTSLELALNVQAHLKTGRWELAYEALKKLKAHGLEENLTSVVIGYIKAGEPRVGERILKEFSLSRILFGRRYPVLRISHDVLTLMVEAYADSGHPELSKRCLMFMMEVGYKPNESSIGALIKAFRKKKLLDEAFATLSEVEKNGFEASIPTDATLQDFSTLLDASLELPLDIKK